VVDSTAARIDRDNAFADDPLVLADVLHALGETYVSLDVFDRAIPRFQRAVELKRSAAGDNDATTLLTLDRLSAAQAQHGDLEAAIETQKQVVALGEQVHGKETWEYTGWLANLGNMYADMGDFARAETILREAVALDRKVLGSDHRDMPYSINNLATVLVDAGKCADAIPLHEESLGMRHRLFGEPSAEMAIALGNYARTLDCVGRYADAELAADSALAMSIIVFGEGHQRTATSSMRLAEVYLHTQRAAQAEPLLRRAIGVYSGQGERYWRTGDARARLGEALVATGRGPEGVSELGAGWEILTETTGTDTPRAREIATRIADYHRDQWPDESRRWLARADGTAEE
jgi:tetratricopeptide (TPR) repeat protein